EAMSAPDGGKAARIARGVQKLLYDMGYDSLREVKLRTRRRVDVMGINDKGRIIIVEVKSGPTDYRVDDKWNEYLEFCDVFYFSVDAGLQITLIPQENGLIITDGFTGAILRPTMDFQRNAARRRNVALRFTRLGARRLLAG